MKNCIDLNKKCSNLLNFYLKFGRAKKGTKFEKKSFTFNLTLLSSVKF